MNTIARYERNDPLRLAFAWAIAIAGVLYLGMKLHFVFHPSFAAGDGYDYRTLWIAGNLWASGQNPYGVAFRPEYLAHFDAIGPGDFFNYPPCWYPILVLLSRLSFAHSLMVWQLVNVVLLVAAVGLTASIFGKGNRELVRTSFLVGLGSVAIMQPTVWVIQDGQTSIMLYLGLATIFYGISNKKHWAVLTGLLITGLKPNIGVITFLLIAMMPEWRRTLAAAVGVLVIASTPALLHHPGEALSGFLANLGRYHGYPLSADTPADVLANPWTHLRGNWVEVLPNAPSQMVGLYHFTEWLPAGLASNILIIMAAILSVIVYRYSSSDELRFMRIALVILTFVPLHSYDMPMLAVPAIFLWTRNWAMKSPAMLIALAGLLLCIRPGNIGVAFNISLDPLGGSDGTLLTSIGLLLMTVPLLIPSMTRADSTLTRAGGANVGHGESRQP